MSMYVHILVSTLILKYGFFLCLLTAEISWMETPNLKDYFFSTHIVTHHPNSVEFSIVLETKTKSEVDS